MSGRYEPLGPVPSASSSSRFKWRIGCIGILAVLASSLVHWQWQSPAGLLSRTQKPESLALEILDATPTYQADRNGWKSHNVSMCAIAAWEDDYLDEWLTYHRLIGVQHFYLYDHKSSPATTRLLLPYIERGLVTLHTSTYAEGVHRDRNTFHRDLLSHCQATYGNTTKWLFHFDVDEYLQFAQLYPLASQPKRIDAGQYQFPLHDYLMQPSLLASRCLLLSRNGVFTNIGLVENSLQSVLDSIQYRTAAVKEQGPGKYAARGTPEGLAARMDGPHICVPLYDRLYAGLADSPKDMRNAQGGIEVQGADSFIDPVIREPLMIAHFVQRSLQDCLDKLNHTDNADNWRIRKGEVMCYQDFIPSTGQIEQGIFESSKYRAEILQPNLATQLQDAGIRWEP